MAERTCREPRCKRPYFSMELCSKHYGIAYRRGALQLALPNPTYHRLTNVDRDSLTATCSRCGCVGIRLRAGGRGAECLEARRAGRRGGVHLDVPLSPPGQRKPKDRLAYPIGRDDYDALLVAQLGRCAICDAPCPDLKVDHDHGSGMVRGLLCHHCNVGLGWFRDVPEYLDVASAYLRNPPAPEWLGLEEEAS